MRGPRRLLPRSAAAIVSLSATGVILAVAVSALMAWTPALVGASHSIAARTSGAIVAQPTPRSTGSIGVSVDSTALATSISVTPTAICGMAQSDCSAGTGIARVSLSASALAGSVSYWPNVQVAFVVETTPYDGVYDPIAPGGESGGDPCAHPDNSRHTACEESNGVPFFVAHAQQIAGAVQAANPHTSVSFALVDYASTGAAPWDDGDGSPFHVDVPQFLPAESFGASVVTSFQDQVLGGGFVYPDSDFADNFLDSSSITALYGTVIGSGLDWTSGSHHVIVWIGSTAPRDPGYSENYCVSPALFAHSLSGFGCLSSACEPSFAFPSGASPRCEGWVKSQDGNTSHSIAALTRTAPTCQRSYGGVCTVDVIDLPTTPTDPYSPGWGIGGHNASTVQQILLNVEHVVAAGCDLARSTGGTWTGPIGANCADGTPGTLPYVTHGPFDAPNTQNPGLLNALRGIGFGAVSTTQAVIGTSFAPLFTFVPFGSIKIATDPQATASCLRDGVPMPSCQVTTHATQVNGVSELAWNWSTSPLSNRMDAGDLWTAAFNVVATGPPYATVPVDACTDPICLAAGSTSVHGLSSVATFQLAPDSSVVRHPFPLARLSVEAVVTSPAPTSSFPPAPSGALPPSLPIPGGLPPLPTLQPSGLNPSHSAISVANVSVQALAGGFLAAGFSRVLVQRQRIRIALRNRIGNPRKVHTEVDPTIPDERFVRFE